MPSRGSSQGAGQKWGWQQEGEAMPVLHTILPWHGRHPTSGRALCGQLLSWTTVRTGAGLAGV